MIIASQGGWVQRDAARNFFLSCFQRIRTKEKKGGFLVFPPGSTRILVTHHGYIKQSRERAFV